MTPAPKRPIVTIETPPGFVFSSVVVSHGWYRLAPFRWSADDQILRRTEILGGRVRDLEFRSTKRGILITGAPDSGELRRKIRRMFQLHLDTSEFIAAARQSPLHAWVEEAGFGRLLCGSTLFEDVV